MDAQSIGLLVSVGVLALSNVFSIKKNTKNKKSDINRLSDKIDLLTNEIKRLKESKGSKPILPPKKNTKKGRKLPNGKAWIPTPKKDFTIDYICKQLPEAIVIAISKTHNAAIVEHYENGNFGIFDGDKNSVEFVTASEFVVMQEFRSVVGSDFVAYQ